MDLKTFKKLSKIYSKLPLQIEPSDITSYEAYINAFHEDKACQEWELKKCIKAAGIDFKKYCCIDMAYRLIEDKVSRRKEEINYDSIVTHTRNKKDFGIPIHDGGSSFIKINYCPWCGRKIGE